MKDKDFEEINDMLGNVIGGNSEQGLFQFSCSEAAPNKVSCSEVCHTSCDGIGTTRGTKVGTVTEHTIQSAL